MAKCDASPDAGVDIVQYPFGLRLLLPRRYDTFLRALAFVNQSL